MKSLCLARVPRNVSVHKTCLFDIGDNFKFRSIGRNKPDKKSLPGFEESGILDLDSLVNIGNLLAVQLYSAAFDQPAGL